MAHTLRACVSRTRASGKRQKRSEIWQIRYIYIHKSQILKLLGSPGELPDLPCEVPNPPKVIPLPPPPGEANVGTKTEPDADEGPSTSQLFNFTPPRSSPSTGNNSR